MHISVPPGGHRASRYATNARPGPEIRTILKRNVISKLSQSCRAYQKPRHGPVKKDKNIHLQVIADTRVDNKANTCWKDLYHYIYNYINTVIRGEDPLFDALLFPKLTCNRWYPTEVLTSCLHAFCMASYEQVGESYSFPVCTSVRPSTRPSRIRLFVFVN